MAGENEDLLADWARRSPNDRTTRVIAGQFGETGQQLVAVTTDDNGPVLEGRPAGQRPRHVGKVKPLIASYLRGQASRLRC
ncbi:hypothetical protein MmonteBS_36330 [Mycobacterium montefiorense]|uniref:Uncharacterized protein n=1 Tax=Mycobacterium montefiorense TaxID=154654 RepID=A0AA37PL77_9MYCO|nr:hypothetical protein MmonteBS_36330 [Mycobacterium montefiorense]GKU45625.1 hypothetical protein NJB14194_22460 [Mycobacterium montefiorense]GKU71511.1 hypothetical protein NJB18185_12870 [Mycobacterium montefiorense]